MSFAKCQVNEFVCLFLHLLKQRNHRELSMYFIGQNGATLTHINEPWRRPIQAQTFNESATIREKMEEFGEAR